MLKIDKSLFSPEELATYNSLIAKAAVDPGTDDEEEEEMLPPEAQKKGCKTKKKNNMPFVPQDDPEDEEDENPMQKSAESPALAAALARLETLEKSYEMKEFTEIAKKYAPLGEKEDELAQTLYDMKKSNEANYNAYIKALDKTLGLVEKSGLFAEIGKSAGGTGGSVTDKIEAAAAEIRKSDATITYEASIAKAWDNNPDLIAEYDKEYKEGR